MVTNIRKNCKLQAESYINSFFLFRQDWCGDLPPAKEKNVLHWLAVPARNASKIT